MKIKARGGDTIEATKPFGQPVEGEVLIIVREVGYPNTRRIILSKQQASDLAHELGGCEGKNAERVALTEALKEVERYGKRIKALEARIAKAIDTLVTNP